MVKVKCILKYFDEKLNKLITPKDVPYEVTNTRAEKLVRANVCEILEVIPDKPKKTRRPKIDNTNKK